MVRTCVRSLLCFFLLTSVSCFAFSFLGNAETCPGRQVVALPAEPRLMRWSAAPLTRSAIPCGRACMPKRQRLEVAALPLLHAAALSPALPAHPRVYMLHARSSHQGLRGRGHGDCTGSPGRGARRRGATLWQVRGPGERCRRNTEMSSRSTVDRRDERRAWRERG